MLMKSSAELGVGRCPGRVCLSRGMCSSSRSGEVIKCAVFAKVVFPLLLSFVNALYELSGLALDWIYCMSFDAAKAKATERTLQNCARPCSCDCIMESY